MKQTGYVRNIDKNKVQVEIKRISSCGGGCNSCGGSCDAPSIVVSMENTVDAKIGDYVEINAKSKNIIKYALVVYMIPFFLLIVGIILGMGLFQSKNIANYETYGLLVGLVFLVLSFFIVKRIDKNIEKKNESTMEIIRILE